MPRKNNKSKSKFTPFSLSISPNKKRYDSKFSATKAADYQMALKPDLVLSVYQDIDGGWYLTRKNK